MNINHKFSNKHILAVLTISAVVFLNYAASHPVSESGGYTGAPNDSTCLNCHTTGDVDGTIELSGIPDIVNTGSTYPITVTITDSEGTAAKAGFQMVTLKTTTNGNSGTYSEPEGATSVVVKNVSSKSYVGHKQAITFDDNNTLTYEVEWTAPVNQGNEEIKFYAAALIADGGNTNKKDRFVTTSVTSTIEQELSSHELDFASQLVIYPIPATDKLNIQNEGNPITDISIYSMDGRKMATTSTNIANKTEVNLENITKGSYILNITSVEQNMSKVILVE